MQLGSMFISNCNIALHVSEAFCIHLQEHLETVESSLWWVTWDRLRYTQYDLVWMPSTLDALTGYFTPSHVTHQMLLSTVSKCSWRWTQKASETCRAILQLQINILPSCITLVLLYILY